VPGPGQDGRCRGRQLPTRSDGAPAPDATAPQGGQAGPGHLFDDRLRWRRPLPRSAGLRPGAAGDGRRHVHHRGAGRPADTRRHPDRRSRRRRVRRSGRLRSPSEPGAPSTVGARRGEGFAPPPRRGGGGGRRLPGRREGGEDAPPQTGQQHIDLSLLDVQVSLLTYVAQYFMTDRQVPGPIGSAHQSVVPYQAFQTADGDLVVAVFGESFWAPLCRAMALEDLIDRYPDNRSEEHTSELQSLTNL